MIKLNLPEFAPKIINLEGKINIFDVLRKKYVFLTPEEWVRQHLVHYLICTLGYPKGLIKLEGGLLYNKRTKRSDIVVFSSEGRPWIVIECKAPHININKDTLFQASVYNKLLNAPYIAISNGLNHFFWEVRGNKIEAIEQLPTYNVL